MQLTHEQQSFVDAVLAAPRQVHILTGEGGAGKTFTTAALAAVIREGALFASPTHQAATVLRGELKAKGAIAEVATVASLLGVRPNYEEEPGGINDSVFSRSGEGSFNSKAPRSGGLLVIDECSMVGEYDLKKLVGLAQGRGLFTVVTGDPEQLQPVQMASCWDHLDALLTGGEAARTHLTRNMRSSSDDLTGYINKVRKSGKLPAKAPAMVKLYKDAGKFAKALSAAVQAAQGDAALMPVGLAFRNATVNELAAEVRSQLGFDPRWHSEGEVLRMAQPYEVLQWRAEYNAALKAGQGQREAYETASQRVREIRLQTGDLVRVVARKGSKTVSEPFAAASVEVQTVTVEVILGELEGRQFDITLLPVGDWGRKGSPIEKMLSECFAVAQSLNKAIKDGKAPEGGALKLAERIVESSNGKLTLKSIPSGRAWSDGFYRVRGQFANAAGAAALTVHKAQGSGRRSVFIDVTDLKGGPGELLYVAVSRAREELHLLVN